jgi:uncharacterized membrane protein
MEKKTMKDKAKLTKLLKHCNQAQELIAEQLAAGDVNEQEFVDACNAYSRTVIIKAGITSLEVMREGA